MRLAKKLRVESVLLHLKTVLPRTLLQWLDGEGNRPNRERLLAQLEARLDEGDPSTKVVSLGPRSEFQSLFFCDGLWLPPAVLEWERLTLLSPGFGGFATHGQWFTVLAVALRMGTFPKAARNDERIRPVLDVTRACMRFYLGTMQSMSRPAELDFERRYVPVVSLDDIKGVLPANTSSLLTRARVTLRLVVSLLKARGIEVPDPEAQPPARLRERSTRELTECISYLSF